MKKFLVCGLIAALMLTGCTATRVNNNEVAESDVQENLKRIVLDKTAGTIGTVDASGWKQVFNKINQIDSDETWTNDQYREYHDDCNSDELSGVLSVDGIARYNNIGGNAGQQAIKILEEASGADLSEMVDEAAKLDEGFGIQKTVNNFGFAVTKENGEMAIYVVKTSIQLNDQTQNEWLKEVCGDQLLLAEVSKWKEKEIYELDSPAFTADRDFYFDCTAPLSQYRIFTDGKGKIEKIRVIVKQEDSYYARGNKKQEITDEVFEPLVRLLASLDKQDDSNQLVNQLMKAAHGEKGEFSGTIENGTYTITGPRLIQNQNVMDMVITF